MKSKIVMGLLNTRSFHHSYRECICTVRETKGLILGPSTEPASFVRYCNVADGIHHSGGECFRNGAVILAL